MIKIRNKRIALLLVLTMLATMFVGVGTASAAPTNYTDLASTWSWIADDAKTGDVGTITISNNLDSMPTTPPAYGNVFVEITLPDGVEFYDDADTDEIYIDGATAIETSIAPDMVVFETDMDIYDDLPVTIRDINLDVDKGITGSISATVRIFAMVTEDDGEGGTITTNQVAFEEEAKALIAKISSDDVTVTAKSAKSLYIGGMQKGADITVKEVGPGAFEDYTGTEDIKVVILTSGVFRG